MYLGTDEDHKGHITLNMLKAATKIGLIGEYNYYYHTEDVAYILLRNMFLSIFVMVLNEFIPRDIEYVFNSKKYHGKENTYISILDFNQVKTFEERALYAMKPYDLEFDIAEVYIDLCGIRYRGTINNFYPSEPPTPQWKFLCNPLLTPSAFILLCIDVVNGTLEGFAKSSLNFDFLKVLNYLVMYIDTNYLQKVLPPYPELRSWMPSTPKFSYSISSIPVAYAEMLLNYDYIIQKLFIFKCLKALPYSIQSKFNNADIKSEIMTNIMGNNFDSIITFLKSKSSVITMVEDDDDWGFSSVSGGYKRKYKSNIKKYSRKLKNYKMRGYRSRKNKIRK